MLAFLIRRLIYAVIAMWAVSVISFVIINLPAGDFVTTYIAHATGDGQHHPCKTRQITLREVYGLNDPVYVQYFKWISRILQGRVGFLV